MQRIARLRAGGDTPEWLPEGAVAFADFTAGHYYLDGAEAVIGDMISGHDVSQISASGMLTTNANSNRAVASAALAAAMVGGTVVISFNSMDTADALFEAIDAASYASAANVLNVRGSTNGLPGEDELFGVEWQDYNDFGEGIWRADYDVDGDNKFALNLYVPRDGDFNLSGSLNGSAATVLTKEAANPCLRITLGWSEDWNRRQNGHIKTITVYSAQADAALPALSALS